MSTEGIANFAFGHPDPVDAASNTLSAAPIDLSRLLGTVPATARDSQVGTAAPDAASDHHAPRDFSATDQRCASAAPTPRLQALCCRNAFSLSCYAP